MQDETYTAVYKEHVVHLLQVRDPFGHASIVCDALTFAIVNATAVSIRFPIGRQ